MTAVVGPGRVSPPGRGPRRSDQGAAASGVETLPLPDELVRSICPYLGTGDGWRLAVPDRAHRCLAVSPPIPLALEKQGRLCLVAAHVDCATFRAARDVPGGAGDRRRQPRADPSVGPPPSGGRRWRVPRTQATVLDVGRGSVDFAAVARQRATTQVALVALALFAFGALVLARVAGGDGVDSASRAPATRAALPPPSIVTTGSAIPSASAGTASSTSSPASPVGLPSSAAAPGGIPAAPTASVRLYTVRAGDTLAAIARRFGTSVGRIRSANEIADPRTLRIGQTLRIP